MGIKWHSKSPEQKKQIKEFYLEFYNNFDSRMCPILIARSTMRPFDSDEIDILFIGKKRYDRCNMCENFKELTKGHCDSCCPCIAFGEEESYRRLIKLLKRWKLIK